MENIEDTLDRLSVFYTDTEYEKNLFDIFRFVSIHEKRFINLKNIEQCRLLRFEFVNKLIEFLTNFVNMYDYYIKFEDLSTKQKIVMMSILRKIMTIMGITDEISVEVMLSMDGLYTISILSIISYLQKYR